MVRSRELSEAQWLKIERLLPKEKPSPHGGRRRIDDREVMEGILWVLRSGARWKDLPREYPSATTCWRRLREWDEVFADGTFASAKKGVPRSARPNAERVQSLWWWQTARVCLSESNLPRRRRTSAR